MTPSPRRLLCIFLLAFAALPLLAACESSTFDPPDMQGPPAMVTDAGEPRLWVLSKQEEQRTVAVGGGSSRFRTDWRTDTHFHFDLQAFDPATAKPLWKKRLLSLGDDEAAGRGPSRVIGSAVDARLLGQDGDIVWLLIGVDPYAVSAADGSVVADPAALQQRNPGLAGLLPSEARHYSFDNGLVFLAADARTFVVRGKELAATVHQPVAATTAAPEPKPSRYKFLPRLIVPMEPLLGEAPARQVELDGQWLGLYSENEAADASDDPTGDHLRWPYTVTDDGTLARRGFWRATIVEEQHFEDRFHRLSGLTPVPGTPVYLKGRFVRDTATGEPLLLQDPAGLLVWHVTRIDNAGRLALTRLDTSLKPLWTTELPLSETGIVNPVSVWQFPGHLVAMGQLQSEDDGVVSRDPHLVTVSLADGARHAWNMTKETAVE